LRLLNAANALKRLTGTEIKYLHGIVPQRGHAQMSMAPEFSAKVAK
jgi:hypothetical protein